jgi:hypothetical protein
VETCGVKIVLSYQPANPKITNLASEFRIEYYVLGLQITMDNLFRFRRVQEAKGTRDFSNYPSSGLPCHGRNIVLPEKMVLEAPIW